MKKQATKLTIIWEQEQVADANERIEAAFEMLLGEQGELEE